jgi:eukaryotic-like serine/threonine-protein kinase
MSDEPRFCPLCGSNTSERVCPEDGVPTLRSDYLPAEGDEDPIVGRVFSERYKIEAVLGEGGFGRVYVAKQLSMARKVALKTLHPHLIANRQHLARFYHEARSISRLTGPHVVRVFDFGVDEDTRTPFLAMELLRGQTLTGLLSSEAPVEPRRAAKILGQIGRAIAEAEEVGLVHRDLKPDNTFMVRTATSDDFVKVMDFGLAKVLRAEDGAPQNLTSTGVVVGTPRYMAPEQVLGRAVDTRTDLYALGCIMHEMLTAQPAFTGKDAVDLLVQHTTRPAPALPDPLPGGASLPPAMAELYQALLAKDAEERPATARLVVDVLDAVEQGTQVSVAAILSAAAAARKPSEEELRPTFDLSVPTTSSETPAREQESAAEPHAAMAGNTSDHEDPATRKVVAEASPSPTDDDKPTVNELESPGDSSILSDFHSSQLGWRSGLLALRLNPWRFVALAAAALLIAGAAFMGVLAGPEPSAPPQAPGAGIDPPTPPPSDTGDLPVPDTGSAATDPGQPSVPSPTGDVGAGSSKTGNDLQKSGDRHRPRRATLDVSSNPPGASVFLGRKHLCRRTPCRPKVPLSKKKVTLVFRMDGYIKSRVEVQLARDRVTRVHTKLIETIEEF